MMSFAATVVVVKSLVVVLCTAVPEEIATPLVLMRFEMVGKAVPVATFQNLKVAVPPTAKMS
jgi:hypothetical protein